MDCRRRVVERRAFIPAFSWSPLAQGPGARASCRSRGHDDGTRADGVSKDGHDVHGACNAD
eukprot:CAMPEP_0168482562 /NCGR_PEP_ID=MMETSP0228-20121227/65097_1 /TAXON_ID=133427 /ORGANISM="Protoceratium reticulatum, Strain CCCM 535 (=CCMP 1889)" /LENGTH=60 /DNA_ID=CAMNT_0008498977 /DNA_START=35 /DNA_END=214 /DNA_ORIENTATION=-